MRYPCTDLHTHILPKFDDGAADLNVSLELLKTEYESGIRQVALTSHFDCERESLASFLERRTQAYDVLSQALQSRGGIFNDLRLKLGAEVHFSPNLCELDVRALCLEGTRYLLLELPVEMMPAYFGETVYHLQAMGVVPLIAHVERYPYIMAEPPVLCGWVDRDIYTQVNAESLLNGRHAKLLRNLVAWNLIHVMASDAHSVNRRRPNLASGLEVVEEQMGEKVRIRLEKNAAAVFDGGTIEISSVYCPRKILGRWR